VEITREQFLHPFFILNDHDQVHSFYTDLQSTVSARNGNERGRTPAIRWAASGYAFAPFTSEDKAASNHVWYNRHALRVLQHFFRDSLVRHPHNFVYHGGGVFQSFGGIFPRRPAPEYGSNRVAGQVRTGI
jgi:hypothetical protein